MAKKIISLFKKAYTKLFHKKTHRTIWGQKFDGWVASNDGVFLGITCLDNPGRRAGH